MKTGAIGLIAVASAAAFAQTNPLNDTGTNSCDAATGGGSFGRVNEPCLGTDPAGQDAQYGRDADARLGLLQKVGAGNSGFDFTKISMSGLTLGPSELLGVSPSSWACTRDNVTGLVWEVKRDDPSHFRHKNWTFSWYSVSSPDGVVGAASGGACQITGRCDTDKYVSDVNTSALCGFRDWRMPSVKELSSIINYSFAQPVVESKYFPNTLPPAGPSLYWSALPSAINSGDAWWVDFMRGDAELRGGDFGTNNQKSRALLVRLVRG